MKECLQITNGPTPCFREVQSILKFEDQLPCDLDHCPVADYLNSNTDKSVWQALHSICVITDPFDYKGNLKSIQLKLIALKKAGS